MVIREISRRRRLILMADVDWIRAMALLSLAVVIVAGTYIFADTFSAALIAIVFTALFTPPLVTRKKRLQSLGPNASDDVRVIVAAKMRIRCGQKRWNCAPAGVLCITSDRMLFLSRSVCSSIPLSRIASLAYERSIFGARSAVYARALGSDHEFTVRNPKYLYHELQYLRERLVSNTKDERGHLDF